VLLWKDSNNPGMESHLSVTKSFIRWLHNSSFAPEYLSTFWTSNEQLADHWCNIERASEQPTVDIVSSRYRLQKEFGEYWQVKELHHSPWRCLKMSPMHRNTSVFDGNVTDAQEYFCIWWKCHRCTGILLYLMEMSPMYRNTSVFDGNVTDAQEYFCIWWKCHRCTGILLYLMEMSPMYRNTSVFDGNVTDVQEYFCIWWKCHRCTGILLYLMDIMLSAFADKIMILMQQQCHANFYYKMVGCYYIMLLLYHNSECIWPVLCINVYSIQQQCHAIL
jgi:hypothetical protein